MKIHCYEELFLSNKGEADTVLSHSWDFDSDKRLFKEYLFEVRLTADSVDIFINKGQLRYYRFLTEILFIVIHLE